MKFKNVLRKVKAKIKSKLKASTRVAVANSSTQQFIPVYQFFSRPGTFSTCVFGWRGKGRALCYKDLRSDIVIEFSLKPLSSVLLGIHLQFGTHGRVNNCSIKVELFSNDSGAPKLIASTKRSVRDFLNNNLNFIGFDPIVVTPAKQLFVRISSPDASSGNYVSLMGAYCDSSIFKRTKDGFLDCTDFYDHPQESTAYKEATRAERFFPRYVAFSSEKSWMQNQTAWDGLCLQSMHLPIYPHSSALLSFLCESNNFNKLVVTLVAFGRRNTCQIDFKLERLDQGAWSEVYCRKIEGTSVHDNSPLFLSFPEISDSKNVWFKLTISSDNASPLNCIGVQGTALIEDNSLFKELTKQADLVSMVDRSESIISINKDVGQSNPAWGNLKEPVSKESFRFVVVVDDEMPRDDSLFFTKLDPSQLIPISEFPEAISKLPSQHLVIFADIAFCPDVESALQLARHCCIPTCFYSKTIIQDLPFEHARPVKSNNKVEQIEYSQNRVVKKHPSKSSLQQRHYKSRLELLSLCDYLIFSEANDKADHVLPPNSSKEDVFSLYNRIFAEYKSNRLPSISLVSILYRKEDEILKVLESIARQDYPGPVEVILVDDCSPDKSVDLVKGLMQSLPNEFGSNGRCPIKILHNTKNLGNCASRNYAITEAKGEIVLIIDADCVLNQSCLSAHADAHAAADVDVVIGTHNLESGPSDPIEVVDKFSHDAELTQKLAQLQDPIVPQSFLNSITRNVSIRREFIKGPLFDELFSYSANPDSGFGWEDVEMGVRLYKQGARFRFVNRAISVHISHKSSCDESGKPARSIKNFRRLLEKHPEMRFISRRWILDTFEKICAWLESVGVVENLDRAWVELHLKGFESFRSVYKPRKELRILSYRWHCPHQYELYKMKHSYSLLSFVDDHFTNSWDYSQRPLRSNVKFQNWSEIDDRDFDLAILHFDENILFPENTYGILGREWGRSFRFIRENMNLPMVAICHGTPQFKGQYNPDYNKADLGSILEFEREQLVAYMGDIPVVCNSHQARAEWRFNNSRVIWHGFDPMEFGPVANGHGILTLGQAMKERPVYRGYNLFQEVQRLLPEKIALKYLRVPRPASDYPNLSNDFAFAKFRLYNQEIRKHSIYFNPTLRSPMPRSRGEAMMSGLVSVSANNHDVSLFIKNGTNGFYSNDVVELADYLLFLSENPAVCEKMGQSSRALAADIFNIDRFHRDWNSLIDDVVA